MAKILRTSDRIHVQIDDVRVSISPLSFHQKAEVQSMLSLQSGYLKAAFAAIKYSVKAVSGIEVGDGEKYELEFEEGGKALSDQCVDDLLNMESSAKLLTVCASMMAGIPSAGFADAEGKPLEGVSIVKEAPGN